MSASVYALAKDSDIKNRLSQMAEKGKANINKMVSEPMLDADGHEMEFVDKLIQKAEQAKDELEEKIEELVAEFYKKINVAHVDEIRALKERLEASERAIALLEARLNRLEAK